MKKITPLIIAFVFGLKSYSQDIEKIKADIKKNKDDKEKINSRLSKLKSDLSELNKSNKSDTIKTILYDFKTKKYLNSNLIPIVGEPLIFKIQNINRLAYNVNITSTDVAIADVYFNPEIKKALEKDEQIQSKTEVVNSTTISNPEIKFSNIQNPSKTISESIFITNAKKIDEEQAKINNNNNLINDLKRITKISTDISEIQKQNLDQAKIDEIDKLSNEKDILEKKTLGKKIETLESENLVSEKEIEKINVGIIKTRTEINATFNKLHSTYKSLSVESQLLANIQSEYIEYRVLALNPLLRKNDYIKIKEENKFLNKIESSKIKINDFELKLINFYNDYNSAINDWSVLDVLDNDTRENVRNRYQTIKLLVDEINRNMDTKGMSNKLCRAVAIDNVLQNEKAYEMTSAPIQPQEDYVTFEVDIKNRDDKAQYEYNDERKFVYMEYTQGGVRFDFSTGVVFDFGNQTSNYELINSGTDKKQIIATSKNDFTPTLSGMFHTSFRRNGIWAFGLTLGASLNVETFQLNSLFPGISLLIGKKQKFVITAGPAFKLVDTLNSNYELNTDYNQANFTSNSALTSEQFKIGGFVGLTYNLTNGQKGTFKISDK